jgi:hypothetical protein
LFVCSIPGVWFVCLFFSLFVCPFIFSFFPMHEVICFQYNISMHSTPNNYFLPCATHLMNLSTYPAFDNTQNDAEHKQSAPSIENLE